MKLISLKEARTLGLKRYFTGKPCVHGHISERQVSARRCIQCTRVDVNKIVLPQKNVHYAEKS